MRNIAISVLEEQMAIKHKVAKIIKTPKIKIILLSFIN